MLPCLEVKYWTPIHMKSSSGLTTESSYQSTEAFWFTFCSLPLLCPSAGRYLGIKCSWSDCWCHSHILSSSIASGRSGIPAPKVRAHGFLLLHQGKTRSPQPGAVTQKQPQHQDSSQNHFSIKPDNRSDQNATKFSIWLHSCSGEVLHITGQPLSTAFLALPILPLAHHCSHRIHPTPLAQLVCFHIPEMCTHLRQNCALELFKSTRCSPCSLFLSWQLLASKSFPTSLLSYLSGHWTGQVSAEAHGDPDPLREEITQS